MHAHHHRLVTAHLPERVPVVGVDAGPAQLGRVLGKGHGMGALGRRASHFGGQHLRVPDGRERTGDEPARIAAAPVVDVPIVVGPHQGQRQVLVFGAGEELAAELGEGREAQRTQHAVGIHVLHPLVDVVAAGTQLLERGRLEAVLLGRPAGHRVEGHVGQDVPFVEPGVGAVLVGDELGGQVHVLGREMALEEVRRLDHVVVHTHHDHVVDLHCCFSFPSRFDSEWHSAGYRMSVVGRSAQPRAGGAFSIPPASTRMFMPVM